MLKQEFKSDHDGDSFVLAKAANIVLNTVVTSSPFQFSGSFPFTHYHINTICQSLGPAKSLALPMFHSFTGCDTTLTFHGHGKKKSWEAWKSFPDVTEAFAYIADYPFTPLTTESPHFQQLERFIITLYDKTSNVDNINDVRKELFCQTKKTIEKILQPRYITLRICNPANLH